MQGPSLQALGFEHPSRVVGFEETLHLTHPETTEELFGGIHSFSWRSVGAENQIIKLLYVLSHVGLLEQLFGIFTLYYFIAVTIRKNPSGADKAFFAATLAFVILSIVCFLNRWRLIPSGYRWRFFFKSLARGLFAPFLSVFHYHVLFGCSDCVKWAFTFSNDAYNGVERTRQLNIFDLDEWKPGAAYILAKHKLLRYDDGKWGYDRRVGELWVRVKFEGSDFSETLQFVHLKTSHDGTTASTDLRDLQTLQQLDAVAETASKKGREEVGVQVTCRECRGDLEKGYLPASSERPTTLTPRTLKTSGASQIPRTSGTPGSSEAPKYKISITWRRGICKTRKRECKCGQKDEGAGTPGAHGQSHEGIQKCECVQQICSPQNPKTCCMWNLKCTVDQEWTLRQIQQHLLCLDAWGNHPKQGIWKPEKETCSSSCSPCCSSCSNSCSTRQLYRYC